MIKLIKSLFKKDAVVENVLDLDADIGPNDEIAYDRIRVGNKYKFQMAHWSSRNWKEIEIKYVSEKYVITYESKRDIEHCVNVEWTLHSQRPIFLKI